MPDKLNTYTIEAVEFRYQHDLQFVADVKQEFFSNIPPARSPSYVRELTPGQVAAAAAVEKARSDPAQGAEMVRDGA
jgi:hypothetical protein